jgi:hypothetical protein
MTSRRTSATTPGALELTVAALTVIALSRLVEPPLAWLVGLLLLLAVLLASLHILHEVGESPAAAGVPIESLIPPAAAAFAGFGAIRLVPIGILLIPALAGIGVLLGRVLATEQRLAHATTSPSSADRTLVLVQGLFVAFVAFAGMGALVSGALPEPGTSFGPGPTAGELALLAGSDALVAFLVGYRVAALRSTSLGDVAWSAATSATVVAIAAIVLRTMEMPRLLGPALLVLVFFLWQTIHGGVPTRRRDPRRIWETAGLFILGVVVVAWSLTLRPSL